MENNLVGTPSKLIKHSFYDIGGNMKEFLFSAGTTTSNKLHGNTGNIFSENIYQVGAFKSEKENMASFSIEEKKQ